MSSNPFAVLGLPERPDLDDETVRAAWRAIAAATHPDRADGGDLARYTQASAAFAELNTPWGRSEAYADLVEKAWRDGRFGDDQEPDTSPLPAVPATRHMPGAPRHRLAEVWELPSRVRRGRPLRLAVRAAVAAVLSLVVLALIPGAPAALADITGLGMWFVLTGRKDLAPPPER
jgi:hypothetical protein